MDAAADLPHTRPSSAATIAGLPLVLAAVALGLGTDVAAWAAPWSLAGAVPYLLGARVARPIGLLGAIVALVMGPAAIVGLVGGVVAGECAARGVRPLLALPLGVAGALATAGTLGVAWA